MEWLVVIKDWQDGLPTIGNTAISLILTLDILVPRISLWDTSLDFFPAFSGAWNIAEEPLIKDNVDWLDMLKVRYSHGKVGNDNMGNERFPYLYTIQDFYMDNNERKDMPGYNWGTGDYNRSYKGIHYSQVASPYITWEEATKNDLGLDISLFRNSFSLTVDYFTEDRTGIYMERNFLPQITGLESKPRANVGL